MIYVFSIFQWAKFRSTESEIKIHTQIDIVTKIPVFYKITNTNIHDVNSLDWLTYEPSACYIFDKGYFDLSILYHINTNGSFFLLFERNVFRLMKLSPVKIFLKEMTISYYTK